MSDKQYAVVLFIHNSQSSTEEATQNLQRLSEEDQQLNDHIKSGTLKSQCSGNKQPNQRI